MSPMNYIMAIAFLAFFAGVQLSVKFNVRPLVSTILAIGTPFIVDTAINTVRLTSQDMPIIGNAVSLAMFVTLLIQTVVAWLIFVRLQNDDSYTNYLILSAAGSVIVIIIVPMLIKSLL